MTQSPVRKIDEEDNTDVTPSEPSWFLSPLDRPDNDELAERYRQHRASEPPRPPRYIRTASYSELIATRPPARDPSAFWPDEAMAEPRRRARPAVQKTRQIGLPGTYAIAALAAVITGGTAGLAAAKFDSIWSYVNGATPAAQAALTVNVPAADPLVTPETAKKPVATASLEVTDSRGSADSPIPLLVSAEPPAGGDDLVLKISGVPDGAYLTAGLRRADKSWSVPQAALEKLSLITHDHASRNIDLAVAGFTAQSGEMVTPVKELTVSISPPPATITPASAPPASAAIKFEAALAATSPSAIPKPMSNVMQVLSSPESTTVLLRDGDKALADGDVIAARDLYGKAFAYGSAEGAMRIGRTYDPALVAALQLSDLKPNPELAAYWYSRAAQAGSTEAAEALTRIQPASAASR